MKQLYVIKEMGRGFDGLLVEGELIMLDPGDQLVSVSKVINRDYVLGDRNVAMPVPVGSFFLSLDYLEKFDGSLREYDKSSPLGEYRSETRIRRHDLEAVIAEYQLALTVTVLEHHRAKGNYGKSEPVTVSTRYSQNYFRDFYEIKQAIDEEVKKGDLDDLIFRLKDLKEKELEDRD